MRHDKRAEFGLRAGAWGKIADCHFTIRRPSLLWLICAIFVRVLDPFRRESGRVSRVSTLHELKARRLAIRQERCTGGSVTGVAANSRAALGMV